MASDDVPVVLRVRDRRDPGGCIVSRRRGRRRQDARTADRIAAALAIWLSRSDMDRDAELLDRLANRADGYLTTLTIIATTAITAAIHALRLAIHAIRLASSACSLAS